MARAVTSRTWAACLVMAALVGCACGDDAAADQAPWCLGEIEPPDDPDAIETVLMALPELIDGDWRDVRRTGEPVEVYYDEPLEGMPSIQAVSVDAVERAFPEAGELTTAELMEVLLEAGAEEVDPGGVSGELDEMAMDADAGLLWATAWTIELDTRAPSMMFADPDGRWIFDVLASSEDKRGELIEAFCDAARDA